MKAAGLMQSFLERSRRENALVLSAVSGARRASAGPSVGRGLGGV